MSLLWTLGMTATLSNHYLLKWQFIFRLVFPQNFCYITVGICIIKD